jgi:hypothetical protein
LVALDPDRHSYVMRNDRDGRVGNIRFTYEPVDTDGTPVLSIQHLNIGTRPSDDLDA